MPELGPSPDSPRGCHGHPVLLETQSRIIERLTEDLMNEVSNLSEGKSSPNLAGAIAFISKTITERYPDKDHLYPIQDPRQNMRTVKDALAMVFPRAKL